MLCVSFCSWCFYSPPPKGIPGPFPSAWGPPPRIPRCLSAACPALSHRLFFIPTPTLKRPLFPYVPVSANRNLTSVMKFLPESHVPRVYKDEGGTVLPTRRLESGGGSTRNQITKHRGRDLGCRGNAQAYPDGRMRDQERHIAAAIPGCQQVCGGSVGKEHVAVLSSGQAQVHYLLRR